MPLRRVALICILVGITAMTAAAARPAGKYWAASIHPQPFPEIRLTSGLTICDEVLWKGYAARVLNHQAPASGVQSPLDVADELERQARTALRVVGGASPAAATPGELECAKLDDEAYGHLGLYYAEKLRAAAALALFLFGGDASHKAKALDHLKIALGEWQRLVAVTEKHYIPHEVWLFGRFHWSIYTPAIQQDIESARQLEAFGSGPQQWQVRAETIAGPVWRDVTLQIIPPFNLTGLHEWLLYFNSLFNWGRVENLVGNQPKVTWRGQFSPPEGEAVSLAFPRDHSPQMWTEGRALSAAPKASARTYDGFLLHNPSGNTEVITDAGTVPQAVTVTGNGSKGILLGASTAAEIFLPLAKTPSGTLLLTQEPAKPEGQSLSGVTPELNDAGSVVYRFQILRPGYYQVSCQVRSHNDRISFYANVDQWLGHEASWSGQTPSNAWQWIESQRAYALGTGRHTLRLLFTRAGDEIGEVRIVPVQ
jgi:hypothetical protein